QNRSRGGFHLKAWQNASDRWHPTRWRSARVERSPCCCIVSGSSDQAVALLPLESLMFLCVCLLSWKYLLCHHVCWCCILEFQVLEACFNQVLLYQNLSLFTTGTG